MTIKGIEDLSDDQLRFELEQGASFVVYDYCVSVVVLTFRRSSAIHFIRHQEGRLVPGLKYSIISFVAGWWGIPWGPIYTIGSLVTNFRGGRNVTDEVLAATRAADPGDMGAPEGT